ncbi:flagellar hook-associated protein FlgK [Arsenicitalea aurantiaca]|uniref:Flagellar hook-associated protein 1 n=1 Tax=Arsenicitalea aurantiaca TaxID=1783274 RepID=A0A433XGA4_9HYPH|nr:flagellar hook-associated protein FlgK [Arsenicitalea aurantiaca]RUT33141.1 flagellar hook-associated protein FlgK [Arsenicitalea aurantiaca]
MGLTATLSNALGGMKVNQSALDIVSRNVANAGTPGYHRQSLTIVDSAGINSSLVNAQGVERAFNQSLQSYYTRQVSDTAGADIQAQFLDRLQTFMGKPGSAGSLDTVFGDFQNALSAAATSPDDYAVRATVMTKAQSLVETLNRLSSNVADMTRDVSSQIGARVNDVNALLKKLDHINDTLQDVTVDPTARAAVLDQRDRIVSSIAEIMDVRVDYRVNGTVALTTRSGIGILDHEAGELSFDPNNGRLDLSTPSGHLIDLAQPGTLQSGRLGGLLALRESLLGETQAQLDSIAAALAQAFSTQHTAGTPTSASGREGFTVPIDFVGFKPGNDIMLEYTQNGRPVTARIVRVDDPTKLPMDSFDADGTRVIGLSFTGGMTDLVAGLQQALGPNFAVADAGGGLLSIMDDGAPGLTSVTGLSTRTTATSAQGQHALPLFLDTGGVPFSNSLDGRGQATGFAARIKLNGAIVADNRLLVQGVPGTTLGDSSRVDYLVGQLSGMSFGASGGRAGTGLRLGGTVGQMIAQTINFQGSRISAGLDARDSQMLTLEALTTQMQSEYGVNIDEEMARLMELQNAYAANARIVSVVQELLNELMRIAA